MKAPLMKLWKEHAFEKKVHDIIPTESHFRSMEEFNHPYQFIMKSVNKLWETDQPTINMPSLSFFNYAIMTNWKQQSWLDINIITICIPLKYML